MGWLTAITALFSSINPIIAVLGTAVGALATYFVNQWLAKQAAQKQAESDMQTAMDQHANDGAQSVADSASVDAQEDRLNQQLSDLDNQVKEKPSGP